MQALTEQVTVLRSQDAWRQRLSGKRASQIRSLQRELTEVCARPLVIADALEFETQECDQLRQSVKWFCTDNE